jgi:hypothetical protein
MAQTMTRISKSQAFKLFCEGKPFIVCPCKCHPYAPWNMGYPCRNGLEHIEDAKRYKEGDPLWKGTLEKTAWALMYNNWAFYNTNYEVGYYAHYYVES